MFAALQRWGSFIKFSHTIFALPFALTAMVVASRETRGWPGWRTCGLILLAMVSARTCAMAFNRIVDRRFDALNPRTATRHLPQGSVSLAGAVVLCVVSATMFITAAAFLNPVCFRLSPIALFLVCFYSMTKRFTDFTHVWLGIALALAPLGAWLAVKGRVDWLPVIQGSRVLRESILNPGILAVAVVLWLIGFDIIYATQDYAFDRKMGLRSLVVRWGVANALAVAFLSHLFMWAVMLAFGLINGFRLAYWAGLIVILGLLIMEHWLARRRDVVSVNAAFFKLNAVISTVFLLVTLIEVALPWMRMNWKPG